MKTDRPLVTVIIPCRNERDCIAGCLRSVLEQDPVDGGYEIIVADGMSTDGTREIIAELARTHPHIRMVDNPTRYAASGLNAALAVARGGIIVRMDAHTSYASDYIVQCIKVLRETGADNVGGPARTRFATTKQQAIAAAYHSPFAVGGARFHDIGYEGPVDTVTYGCWPKETFDRYGMFDETMIRNQDDEHNLRICRGGGCVWQSPRIQSWYMPRDSLCSLFRQYYQYGYWKVRVIRKHRIPASFRHLVPGIFVSGLLVSLIAAWHVPLIGYLGLASAIAYAAGLLLASLTTAARTNWRLFPLLPPVFLMYHFGYGFGFLHGLIDVFMRRRSPWSGATTITRSR